MESRIIETAEKRFFQYGFKRVAMDDIASDLGISKKTLYKYFRGKEAIASAVMKKLLKDINMGIQRIKRENPDSIERLGKLVEEVSNRLSSIGSTFMDDLKKDIPELWRRLEDFREKKILADIEDILKEGIKEGKVRKEINTKIATLVYLGAIRMVIQPEVLVKSQFSIDEAFSNIFQIFLKGIQNRGNEENG